ncbi:MinD/ParA family protein [Inhella sp.]|uniref:MinD/ParA family ATP-binding protein n=1 Tax=Inhella sp. TaxID=1921806 RepID=UPI0035B3103B
MLRTPRDQAAGLRRLFAPRGGVLVPVLAQAGLEAAELMLDALVGAYLERGLQVLVVDAGPAAKPAPELARINLAACLEALSDDVQFLEARGLPGHYLDARGNAGSLVEALRSAAPQADVILLHAPVAELARVLVGQGDCRPILLTDLQPQAMTQAYAAMKWLQQRAHCQVFGLLVAGHPRLALTRRIAEQLADCAERFLGAALPVWAALDPRAGLRAAPSAELRRLARDSLLGLEPQRVHHGALEYAPLMT